MRKKKTKNYTLNEHKIAITKYTELSNEWQSSKSLIYDKSIFKFELTKCNLHHDWESLYQKIDLLKNICELRLHDEKPKIEDNLLYEVLQKLYAYIADLSKKLKNLEKIIISFAKGTIPLLNFDRRESIRKLKHNFRHFDDEDNLELNISSNNQQFNSNNFNQWISNLRKKSIQLFQIQILAMN